MNFTNILKNVWNYLSGKKTFLGLAAYFLVGGLKQIGLLDVNTANQILPWVDGVVGVGVAHKVYKALA